MDDGSLVFSDLLKLVKEQGLIIEKQAKQIQAQAEQIQAQAEQIHLQKREIEHLKVELKKLTKQNQRPKISPSNLAKDDKDKKNPPGSSGKRPGSSKKKKQVKIDATKVIKLRDPPIGSRPKGYADFMVQDIKLESFNTLYRLERRQLADGSMLTADLPAEIDEQHFGPELRRYIIHQYHGLLVTEPLIQEGLRDLGIDISSGQIHAILTENKDDFHAEKDAILKTGLSCSTYVNVDDTGARHKGKNGYCTHIGNELFAWFASTQTKSRINFLELLRQDNKDYVIDENAITYMQQQGLAQYLIKSFQGNPQTFTQQSEFERYLIKNGVHSAHNRRIATEAAIVGSILKHGFNIDLCIVSDDAGQFDVFEHALCWIHAERKLKSLIGISDGMTEKVNEILEAFWALYQELKAYKKEPTPSHRQSIDKGFDVLCNMGVDYGGMLTKVMKKLKANKNELLLVLQKPEIPLHNNLSEGDIREFVKRRKISGGTRSDNGRKCRDSFASLKKTCRKLGLSFWDYLGNKIKGITAPNLPEIILQKAAQIQQA